MFFSKTVLKRLLKSAYTGAGLTVGHTPETQEEPEGYYLSSGWWVIWFDASMFPKEAKAAVIELCGELPKANEVYKAEKGFGNQYEIEQKENFDLPAGFERCKVQYRVTNIIQMKNDIATRLLQGERKNDVRAIQEVILNLIDLRAIDGENGETTPEGPYAESETSPFAYWGNNCCYLMAAIRTTDDEAEKEFWRYLEGTTIV